MEDIRFTAGLLDLSDAARYLGIPKTTFGRWATGYDQGDPLLHVLPARPRAARVTFIAFMEAYVLQALRSAGVNPRRIRPALQQLQKEFGRKYVLMAPELATDGIDVLWDYARSHGEGELIEGSTNQIVMREIVEDYLQYVWRSDDGFPSMIALRRFAPSTVLLDPHRSFGQPFFKSSRTRVGDVVGMLKAEEDPRVIVDELGVSLEEVRSAARVLLGRAA